MKNKPEVAYINTTPSPKRPEFPASNPIDVWDLWDEAFKDETPLEEVIHMLVNLAITQARQIRNLQNDLMFLETRTLNPRPKAERIE